MDNISAQIRNIINNMPSDLNELEKVRWVYMNLGLIINYDYKNLDFLNKVSIDDEYISRYQTCVQVADIMNQILTKLGIKCENLEREVDKLHFDQAHVYNVVTLDTDEKIVLDLVYDLHLIKNNFRTLNFGYKDDGYDYIIISQFEDKMMDEKLGLRTDYKDDELNDFRIGLERSGYNFTSYEEEVDYIISKVLPYMNNTNDIVEGTNLLDYKLFEDIIRGTIVRHNICNNNKEKIRVYLFTKDDDKVWYLYTGSNSLIKSSMQEVQDLISNGWVSKSGNLYEYLDQGKRL